MARAYSKLTARGQTSVPAGIRQRLGIGPGSVLEWDERDGQILVRRAAHMTSDDIHKALFPAGSPKLHTLDELEDGLRQYVRRRHGHH